MATTKKAKKRAVKRVVKHAHETSREVRHSRNLILIQRLLDNAQAERLIFKHGHTSKLVAEILAIMDAPKVPMSRKVSPKKKK